MQNVIFVLVFDSCIVWNSHEWWNKIDYTPQCQNLWMTSFIMI